MSNRVPSKKVLVTGANGFIGLHTVLRLLQLGHMVHATVRTDGQQKNVQDALSRQVDTGKLEFCLADLIKDDGWQAAIRGCDYVIHTASPVPLVDPKDEEELINPARDGSLRILRFALAEQIKRVVFLSSTGAIVPGHAGENRTFTEADWTNLDKCRRVYCKSKTLAERAAWDLINSPENKSGMEMVAINPSNVLGPVLDGRKHASIELHRSLMHAEVPGVARIQFDFVDVRDLADILAQALTEPRAAGKRFICNAASIPMLEIAEILHQNFSARGYRVPTRTIPDAVVRIYAFFIPKGRIIADSLQQRYSLSTEQIRSVFGWQPRPYRQTLIDMGESLIEFGLV